MSRVAKPENWDGVSAIVLAHGAGQGIESRFMTFFHEELSRRGFLSVDFNFDYMAQGRKIPDPMPRLQARYRSVIQETVTNYHPGRLFVGGKSMGGRVASMIAHEMSEIDGLIFLGYPLHPPGKPDQLRVAHLYTAGKPMLFVSGTKDPFAEHKLLENVVKKIGANATLMWVEGGDHSLNIRKSGVNTLADTATSIDTWVRKNFRLEL